MKPINYEELTKMLENERNREYFRWYVSTHNAVKPAKKSKRGNTMKLNKTLALMRAANLEGGAITIYGNNAFRRVLNFKAVKSAEQWGDIIEITLTDGTTITAFFSDIEY